MSQSLDSLPGPRKLPGLGSVVFPAHRSHLVFERWAKAHGPLFQASIGPIRCLGVLDPAIARECLQDRPHRFRRSTLLTTVSKEMGTYGLFSAEGDDWRRQRRLMNPSFHQSHLAKFEDLLMRITGRLLPVWNKAAGTMDAPDVLPILMRYTVDVTSALSFGVDLDTLSKGSNELQEQITELFGLIHRRFNSPIPYWNLPVIGPWFTRRGRQVADNLHATMQGHIEAARARAERGDDSGELTLLDTMIAARDDEGARLPMTDAEIRANILTLLLAGEDTTANTLAFAFDHLARNPDVQQRAREEAQAVLDGRPVPDVEAAGRLTYIDAVLQETLRLTPPTPLLTVQAREDTVVAGIDVPKHCVVFFFPRLACRSAEYFEDPLAFRPERWLDLDPAERRRKRRLVMAFGSGPRVCPGRNLAILESAMVLGSTLAAFRLEPGYPNEPVQERSHFTVQPEGARVRFRRLSE